MKEKKKSKKADSAEAVDVFKIGRMAIPRGFETVEIKVNGKPVTVAVTGKGSPLPFSKDMDKEFRITPAVIAYYGSVEASALEEHMMAEAVYRNWVAKMRMQSIEADPKMAEWKVTASIESSDTFLKLKKAIAISKHNLTLIENFRQALMRKHDSIRSKGATDRHLMSHGS